MRMMISPCEVWIESGCYFDCARAVGKERHEGNMQRCVVEGQIEYSVETAWCYAVQRASGPMSGCALVREESERTYVFDACRESSA